MDKEVTKMTTVLDIIMIDQLMHLWVHSLQLQTGEKNRLLFNWTIFRQSPWKIYLWKNVGTAEAHFYRSTAFLTPNWQCQSIKQKQHTSSNASPLPSGWTVFRLSSAEAIFRIGPMHITNVTKGQENLLEVLVKRKRVAGPTWYKSLGCKICTTKREYLRSIVAGHLHKKWNEVSSSSKHTGHKGSVQAVTTVTCLIKKLCAKWKQFKQTISCYSSYLSVDNLLHRGSFERHHCRVEHVLALMSSVHNQS